MRILALTNIYPTAHNPALGIFVEQQIKGLRQIGMEVEVVFVNRAQQGPGVYLRMGRQIRTRIACFQPDLVHAMYGGVMADQVMHIVHDRPIVVTFHGSDLLGERSSGLLRRVITYYGVLASWRAAQRVSGIVAVSKALQDALPEYVDRSKVRIIPCGIDLERFKPLKRHECRQRLGWDPDCFHVLFPSNSSNSIKRPGLARTAVDIVNLLGVRAEMHYLHSVLNSDVPMWLNASDVLLLTSLHEGSPTIVKEALACNLPVVSVDVGDVRERIHGIDGCYLALPDPNDLAAKLSLVHAHPRRIVGRIKMQELSLERIALCLREFYREILTSWKAEPRPNSLSRERSDQY
jgi:teichuronic acid biosynthesis glycosyltransferase TuaC